jgi:hypothetical protein
VAVAGTTSSAELVLVLVDMISERAVRMYRPRKAGGWGALPHLTLSIKLLEKRKLHLPRPRTLSTEVPSMYHLLHHTSQPARARGAWSRHHTAHTVAPLLRRSPQPLPLPLSKWVTSHPAPSGVTPPPRPGPRPVRQSTVNEPCTVHAGARCTQCTTARTHPYSRATTRGTTTAQLQQLADN